MLKNFKLSLISTSNMLDNIHRGFYFCINKEILHSLDVILLMIFEKVILNTLLSRFSNLVTSLGNHVQVGRVGQPPFISHQFDKNMDVNYIGLHTGWGHEGLWKYCGESKLKSFRMCITCI